MPVLDKLVKMLQNPKGFDTVLSKVKIVAAGNGSCVAEFKVEREHTNPMGGLHGGFSATLVDVISSFALRTLAGESVHVSANLQLQYLRAAMIGDELVVDAKTLRAGKTLAFLDIEIKNKKSGDLLVKGTHMKCLTDKKLPW